MYKQTKPRLHDNELRTGSSELKKSFSLISDSSLKLQSQCAPAAKDINKMLATNRKDFESKTEGSILSLCKIFPYPNLEHAAPDYAPLRAGLWSEKWYG